MNERVTERESELAIHAMLKLKCEMRPIISDWTAATTTVAIVCQHHSELAVGQKRLLEYKTCQIKCAMYNVQIVYALVAVSMKARERERKAETKFNPILFLFISILAFHFHFYERFIWAFLLGSVLQHRIVSLVVLLRKLNYCQLWQYKESEKNG